MTQQKQNLDRFKLKWFSNGFMYEVITLNVNDDYAIVRPSYGDDFTPDEEVKISDGILLQCSGLKDKNGNFIYEGDVLETTYHNTENLLESFTINYKIEYQTNGSWFRVIELKTARHNLVLDYYFIENSKIIGNIHTHSKLLTAIETGEEIHL